MPGLKFPARGSLCTGTLNGTSSSCASRDTGPRRSLAYPTSWALPVGRTVHVYVARTQEQFRTLQPGNAPTWADATAYPGMGTVFLRDPKIRIATDEPVEQVLDHELVHILLGRAFAPAIPPSWLQEGVRPASRGPDRCPDLAHAVERCIEPVAGQARDAGARLPPQPAERPGRLCRIG